LQRLRDAGDLPGRGEPDGSLFESDVLAAGIFAEQPLSGRQVARRFDFAIHRGVGQPAHRLESQVRCEGARLHNFIEHHPQVVLVAAVADHLHDRPLPLGGQPAALKQF
jgi:hypothetical protein